MREDMTKNEATSLAGILKEIGIDTEAKQSGGRWVVMATIDTGKQVCITTTGEKESLKWAMYQAVEARIEELPGRFVV